ncbi:MAG: hypothetical protein H6807_13420 [Planctomycetes bacterium]|nr:hypothetical protein [Planctomycetota bacterium]
MNIRADKDPRIQEKLAELREEEAGEREADLLVDVAMYFDMIGDSPRTIAALEAAVAAAADDTRPRFLLARCLIKAGRWRDGGKELEIVSDMDSVEVASPRWQSNNLYYIAYALFNTGRYKEAAEAFRAADVLVSIWGDPLVLKRFHLHQGFAWHLEGQFGEAAESYRRAMVAPGPGDSCDEDVMDEDEVEDAQDFNDEVEPYMEMARRREPLAIEDLPGVLPAFP